MAEGKILPYLDIPFQHASARPEADEAPGRGDKTLERIQRWRAICPRLTIRSTFIVGFPGETEAEFEELLDFLDEAQLDRVGAFAYSPVDGAKANALPDPVPEDVKQERLAASCNARPRSAPRACQGWQRKVGSVQRVLRSTLVVDGRWRGESADHRSDGRCAGDRRPAVTDAREEAALRRAFARERGSAPLRSPDLRWVPPPRVVVERCLAALVRGDERCARRCDPPAFRRRTALRRADAGATR
jgi:hypothetical protein